MFMHKSATLKELMLGLRSNEKIFAVDLNNEGKKYFLSGTRLQYIQSYNIACSHRQPNWYEIILVDRATPVVLDIESTEKVWVHTLESVKELMKVMKIAVECKTGEEDEYYYLDSSNEKKVSFHIVGSVYFENLAHVGALVRTVWAAIQSMINGDIPVPDNIDLKTLKYLFDSSDG